jgi:hypothetical protein
MDCRAGVAVHPPEWSADVLPVHDRPDETGCPGVR